MLDLNDGKYGNITRKYVFSRVSEEEVFVHYLGNFKYGKVMNSPLRRDKTPSWAIFMSENGLRFKDFANGESGDCIEYVKKKYFLDYKGAILKIYTDLIRNTPNRSGKPKVTREYKKKSSTISIKKREFSDKDLMYWNDYGISSMMLKMYDVYACSNVWVNDNMVYYNNHKNPAYAYRFHKDDNYTFKIYKPQATEFKWMSNVDKSIIQGWDQLPSTSERLIITKSLKDVMTLRSMGFYSVAIQNETILIKDSVMGELKSRFNNILVIMDHDPAGITISDKFEKRFDLRCEFIKDMSKIKDISDHRKIMGKRKTMDLILKLYET